jgi:hypothetical protein
MTWNSTVDRFRFSHPLWLDDNDALYLGNSSDLQIYHDGSNSYLRDTGTGILFIEGSSQVQIRGINGDKFFRGIEDAAVSLYYDNAAKLATTSSGIDVTTTQPN